MLPLPLYLVRVLDLTHSRAGACAGRALADLGAEVLRLEAQETDVEPADAAHRSLHRNKFSIDFDVVRPEGAEVLQRLLAKCDVVLADAADDLEYEAARDVRDDVIFVSIGAADESGAASAGLAAAAAAVTALFRHRETGEGGQIAIEPARVAQSLAVAAPDEPPPGIDDFAASAYLHDAGFFEPVAGAGGVAPVDGVPYRFGRTPAHVRLPVPRRGEHTAAVLHDLLGLTDAEITAIRRIT
jgi:crotonobetainyl-CoA:carnitine CoA-transferase CaiB-like acyl-CoA transferase